MFVIVLWFCLFLAASFFFSAGITAVWWVICFWWGVQFPADTDVATRAIAVALASYGLLATHIIRDIWRERRATLLAKAVETLEEEKIRTRIPLPLHLLMLVLSIILLAAVGSIPRADWTAGAFEMGLCSFVLCLLFLVAVFMSDPEHDIWGRVDVPTSMLKRAESQLIKPWS